MSAKAIAHMCAGVLFSVLLICTVLAFVPPEARHSHSDVGLLPGEKLTPIVGREQTQLQEVAEPVSDVASWVADEAGLQLASAHKPFPKFCGHYPAARPNHNYYYQNSFWKDGYHYDEGTMDHAIGTDYHYVFRCGSSSHHYEDWPQGWW